MKIPSRVNRADLWGEQKLPNLLFFRDRLSFLFFRIRVGNAFFFLKGLQIFEDSEDVG